MSENVTAATLVSVTAGMTVFTSLLPPFHDVRKSISDEGMVNDVRMGEVASAALVIGIGLTATTLTRSPMPLLFSVAASAAMVVMYESVLATQPKETVHGNTH